MPPQNLLSDLPGPIRLCLPASSANLGPGFDALGLALSLYLTVEAEQADELHIEATGRDAELCGSLSNNLILMTYSEVLGHQGLAAPAIALKINNEIPLGMGCGSSAAALLAGVFLANHFGQLRWSPQQILDEACRREGHPDNVAACFYGGMTASAMMMTDSVEPELSTVAATCGRDLSWPLLLALPHAGLSTAKARALLPETYSRKDAVANVQATALLVSAFAMDRPDLLNLAMRDCLHQPFRTSACPLLPALLPLAGKHGICGVALSGAGPAVLLIAAPNTAREPNRHAIVSASEQFLSELMELRVGQPTTTSIVTR
jgi:homoserine kinase